MINLTLTFVKAIVYTEEMSTWTNNTSIQVSNSILTVVTVIVLYRFKGQRTTLTVISAAII